MSASLVQLLVLAGIAIFLILKLRAVLGTRDGFEPEKRSPAPDQLARGRRNFEVIEGGEDHDITDHVAKGSPAAEALALMKRADPAFKVGEFLKGARGAYEMILMAFERGDIEAIRPFLSDEVEEGFAQAQAARNQPGKTIEANFAGIREMTLVEAEFDPQTRLGEVTIRFVGELTSVTKDEAGKVIAGSPTEIRRQRDLWTFARHMDAGDPNWQLVATGE